MPVEWKKHLTFLQDLIALEDAVDVHFENGRSQRVTVQDAGDRYELCSVVAKKNMLTAIPDIALRAWRRNRSAQLVGFRIDRYGRLVGEAWAPKAGLTGAEFQFLVRRLAQECDRFEYLLTGQDVE